MEVVNLSTTDYRNQEALNKALNIYRAAMRPFIISCLRQIRGTDVESAITDSLGYRRSDEIKRFLIQKDRNIESVIDINDFPHIIHKNWDSAFGRYLKNDKTFRNQLWLIVECRNSDWAHPPEGDAEFERTRAHLFLIADVLGKINNPDDKDRVESIRDGLCSDDTAEWKETEERLATALNQLAAVEVKVEEDREIRARSTTGESKLSQVAKPRKKAKPRSSIAERYVTETTEDDRNSLAVQIAEMRINATGSRPIAWKKIREQFGLKNDQFHKVIRESKGYRDAVIARIKTLKAQDGGWKYNGKLGRLTGIDNIEDFLK